MANLAHTNDCLTYMYHRSGENASTPNFSANALLYLNLAHRDLSAGTCKLLPQIVATFPWAKSAQPKTLILQPSITTGTVSITQNNSSITFSSAPASSVAGYHIKFGSNETTYRIDSHTAGAASATLDSVVINTTAPTSTYTLFKIDYTVGSSDILRIVDMFSSQIDPGFGTGQYKLIAETEESLRRFFPTISSGLPTHFALLYYNEGTFTVRFNKYLDTTSYRRLEAPYIPIPSDLTASDASIPLPPKHHRQTLCDLALYYLFQDKNDDKAQESYNAAGGGLLTMLKEIGMTDVTFTPFKPNEEAKLSL